MIRRAEALAKVEELQTALDGRTAERNSLRTKLDRVLEANDRYYAENQSLREQIAHALPQVWSVLRHDQEDGIYLFLDEHRARQYAAHYGDEAVVNRETVMNDSAAAQFLIDSVGGE